MYWFSFEHTQGYIFQDRRFWPSRSRDSSKSIHVRLRANGNLQRKLLGKAYSSSQISIHLAIHQLFSLLCFSLCFSYVFPLSWCLLLARFLSLISRSNRLSFTSSLFPLPWSLNTFIVITPHVAFLKHTLYVPSPPFHKKSSKVGYDGHPPAQYFQFLCATPFFFRENQNKVLIMKSSSQTVPLNRDVHQNLSVFPWKPESFSLLHALWKNTQNSPC